MNPTLNRLIDGLIPFLEGLRLHGYRVQPGQIMSADWLLRTMVGRGEIPDDLRELGTWIGPIVCTSPREQEDFAKRFDQWIGKLQPGQGSVPDPTRERTSRDSKPNPQELESRMKRIEWRGLIGIAVVTIVAVAIFSWTFRKSTPGPTGFQVAGRETPWNWLALSTPAAITVIGAIAFIISGGLWLLFRALTRRAEQYLGRRVAKGSAARPVELTIELSETWTLDERRRLGGAAVNLIQRRVADPDPNTIDVPATLARFVRFDGPPEPIPASRRITPEYLVLIDRLSLRDHQADRAEAMVDAMVKDQVSVDRYEFAVDPRACVPTRVTTTGRALTLRDLAERHPDHRLLIFSDASGLIDPRNGRLVGWVEQFGAWPLRAVLTPIPRASWSGLEHDVTGAGFLVETATPAGMADLSAQIRGCGSFEFCKSL